MRRSHATDKAAVGYTVGRSRVLTVFPYLGLHATRDILQDETKDKSGPYIYPPPPPSDQVLHLDINN